MSAFERFQSVELLLFRFCSFDESGDGDVEAVNCDPGSERGERDPTIWLENTPRFVDYTRHVEGDIFFGE